MKQFLFLALIVLGFATQANAQNYQKLDWDVVRFGYLLPTSEGSKGGISLGTELRYNVTNRIAAGVRAEFAMGGGKKGSGTTSSVSAGASGSYSLTGDYYFKDNSNTRAFVGVGLGTYTGGSFTGGNTTDAKVGRAIGFSPRLGYDLGFFRTTVEYNLVPDEGVSNYLSLNLAINLFGRYRS